MKGEFVQQKIDDGDTIVISTDKKILYLNLMKKWFDQIASGEKKIEYRQVKNYWVARLFDKDGVPISYDYVIFRNGYAKDSPSVILEYNGVVGISDFEGVECFELELGNICENVSIEKEMSSEEKVAEKREKIMGFR